MAKKTKLPKHIAGVKIPKDLRRKGGKLLAQANSPAGREVIAAGLTMAAAAAATAAVEAQRAKRTRPASADPATGEPAAAAPSRPGEAGTVGIDPQAIADTVGKAADALLSRLLGAKS